jgi:hypothetical protein
MIQISRGDDLRHDEVHVTYPVRGPLQGVSVRFGVPLARRVVLLPKCRHMYILPGGLVGILLLSALDAADLDAHAESLIRHF